MFDEFERKSGDNKVAIGKPIAACR
jgi:hypothetical protein